MLHTPPFGALPLLLALYGLWAMRKGFAQREKLDVVGYVTTMSFWSFIFAVPALYLPPKLIITLAAQAATMAITIGCLQLLNVRAAGSRNVRLIVDTALNWRLPLLLGAAFLTAVDYFSLEIMSYDCTRGCGTAGYVLGTDSEFAALFVSNFFGALGLSMCVISVAVALERAKAG